MPRLGQMNDALQTGFFFVMDLTGCTHTLMGVIDVATLLHLVRSIESRAPAQTLAVLQRWMEVFGIPQQLACDLGGAFRGEFEDALTSVGVDVRFCDPEAHWQMGRIERHNDIFRRILERTIDEGAAVTKEGYNAAAGAQQMTVETTEANVVSKLPLLPASSSVPG